MKVSIEGRDFEVAPFWAQSIESFVFSIDEEDIDDELRIQMLKEERDFHAEFEKPVRPRLRVL